jgi:hypothetical protein
MASGKAVYCFDIDGTLCTQRSGDYDRAEPWPDRIAVVNSLWDAGHRIILYTALSFERGMSGIMNCGSASHPPTSSSTIAP